MKINQKIIPCLWFDDKAEEAISFYTSIFKNSKIVSIQYYPEGATEEPLRGMEGKVLTAIFELEGQRFMALDGGPLFNFTGAISFYVECENQDEVNYYWEKLSAVSEAEQCGWLQDKYGISWQIIPKQLGEMLSDSDTEKAARVMTEMLKMKKIVLPILEKAYQGTEE